MPLPSFTRRRTLAGLGGLALAGCNSFKAARFDPDLALAQLDWSIEGRLGVYMIHGGRTFNWRGGERFGMCSTFKLPLAAVILREVDAGRLTLDQWVPYSAADIVFHAPVTGPNLEKAGMTVGALAEAAQITSDNVAANLLLKLIGGPDGFTTKLRELDDGVTRLDRFEPEMNFVPAGELRDTTTPAAMARLVARIFDKDALAPQSRDLLAGWTIATKTGFDRLRRNFPADWRAGDKTGTASAEGMPNKHNDVAIVWPPQGGVAVVAAYYDAPAHFETIRPADNAVLAEVGRVAASWIADNVPGE